MRLPAPGAVCLRYPHAPSPPTRGAALPTSDYRTTSLDCRLGFLSRSPKPKISLLDNRREEGESIFPNSPLTLLSHPQPPHSGARGQALVGGRGPEHGRALLPQAPRERRGLKFQHGAPRSPQGPLPPTSPSGDVLRGGAAAEPRSGRGGPVRPRGPSEPARPGSRAQAGARRRRRPGARGLRRGGGGWCRDPAAAPPARRGPPVGPAPRGRRSPPPSAVPAVGARARRGLLSLTLCGRERRPGTRGGAGSTAPAARSESPPPQLLRCRRAARQETGGFGAGRPRHVPASGPRRCPETGPLKGQASPPRPPRALPRTRRVTQHLGGSNVLKAVCL
ncbi:collagen alpha-1(I) chain-like [Bos javanicus]|uniref:collagen alpha-1(I) chain-like n=1 Tax=Bos javanicus TaxID=9906 RepID=UPI002AA7929E|nr:collagen alpha-1(I) chain-like [Bos javanicus]